MSNLFRDYYDNSCAVVSQMRSSREEDWGVPSQRHQQRRRPRVIVRRRRIVEEG